jgi:enediyne biosynthesis protein E4
MSPSKRISLPLAALQLCLAVSFALCQKESGAKPAATPQLVDITASTGIHFDHLSSPEARFIVESMSGGVAIIDYDNDGYPDLYFTNAPSVAMYKAGTRARSALYHNNHDGTFTDVTDKAGVGYPCWAMGVAVGDFDNDGWPDLAVSCFGGVVLYHNNHDGTFTDVTKKAGLDHDEGWATGLTFGDYDNDGLVDLFVPHYVDLDLNNLPVFGKDRTCTYHSVAVQCGPRGLKGSPDALYHNNGDGTFTDVSEKAGVHDPQKFFGLQGVWTDIEDSGHIDLFVANDGQPNYLYHNEGDGHFKDIAADAGVAFSEDGNEQANMGVALGDYTRTGRESIAITHFSEEYAILFRNDGALNFTDVAHTARIAQPTGSYVGWGDAFIDTDNRGLLDFLMVNGHVYPQVDSAKVGITYREPKLLFWNEGDGTFRDISTEAGKSLSLPQVSRGLAVGDLFNTGRLDIVIENLTGGPMILETRPNPANHWVSFQLEGSPSNRLALNAKIWVTVDGVTQMSEVLSGSSYLSQSDVRQHFGLGSARTMSEVRVRWPDGKTQTFHDVASDCFYRLREGGSPVVDNRIGRTKSTR